MNNINNTKNSFVSRISFSISRAPQSHIPPRRPRVEDKYGVITCIWVRQVLSPSQPMLLRICAAIGTNCTEIEAVRSIPYRAPFSLSLFALSAHSPVFGVNYCPA